METYTMTQAAASLREYFGYDSFHPGQEALIEKILAGQDVLGIMPTGAGKSICYQIPALLLPGITVIVSPLISLMKDQVDGLNRAGVPAALLNSSLSAQELDETYRALEYDAVKLLYIAPERLEAEGFADYLASLEVSMVAVDEAHCVSKWGHDFRPSYRRIREMIAAFPTRPRVGAFTATATERVREDILGLLDLQDPYVLTTGFDRANLYFAVHAPADRDAFVLDYLRQNGTGPGIVYCITRKQVEKLAETLRRSGFSALPYHAGLPDEVSKENQEAFRDDAVDIIVATNAFGMGIDKSNVRFVLHYGMPRTLENYYQEAGRAGRDGEKADCILLYSAQDVITNRFLIDRSSDTEGGSGGDKSGEYRKLQEMIDYCNGDSCLRGYILRYFGAREVPENCGNCLNCSDTGEQTDITVEAQKILSCVIRMGNRFGSLLVAQVLKGADTAKIRQLGFRDLTTYGIMKDYSQQSIKEIISYLVARGYLEVRGDEYPVLAVGRKGMAFLKERKQLFIKRSINTAERRKAGVAVVHTPLFEGLRKLRRDIAADQGVAPYLIFSDATLADMCAVLPRDREEMRLVSGVGRYKLEQYGDDFIFLIKEYMDANNIPSPPRDALAPAPRRRERDGGKDKELGDTVTQTYQLYTQGKTIEEIAAERDVTTQTVENHLVKAHRAGMAVDLDGFIPEEHREAIMAAIEEQGTERLRPIKDMLPEEVGYTAIRFAIEQYIADRKAGGGE